jgi:hypothetical protein
VCTTLRRIAKIGSVETRHMGIGSGSVTLQRLVLVAGLFLLPGCGGSSTLEFYGYEPGNFRILAAGKPVHTQKNVPSPAGQLTMNTMETVDSSQIRRVVIYTDLPQATVDSSDPGELLDRGITGMKASGQWSIEGESPVTLDDHPGRDVRFAINPATASSEKGAGRARVFLVGNRLYQAIMVGPASKVSAEELDRYVKSFELLKKTQAVARPAPIALAVADPAPAASDPARVPAPVPSARASSTLVAQTPTADRPVPASEPSVFGQEDPPSTPATRTVPVSPRPSLRSSRVAGRNQARPEENFVEATSEGPDPSKPATVSIQTHGKLKRVAERPPTNGNDRDHFRDLAPEHGLLVGMRVGYVNAFGGSKVGMVQPIYQVETAYIEGKVFGAYIPTSVTVVAKPGYAIGAINIHAGLLVDSFQIVFAKFKNGKFETRDNYRSEWIGDTRGGGSKSVSGEGRPIIGIQGRSNGREINALGLLVFE